MLVYVWLIATALLLLLAAGQIVATIIYGQRLKHYVPIEVPTPTLPHTLVILSLRGGDEALVDCLDRLAKQDYPRYELRIVVDHPTDPAYEVVKRWLESQPQIVVEVEFLRNPSRNSTLKCSAIRQVLQNLDGTVEAVVFVDADADPYPHWLRDLASPLTLANVGAVTGNRWYFPDNGSWGDWCRFIYNGLAVPPMDWFELTWGGSLAVRRDVAQSDVFLSTLERSPCEDLAVRRGLKDLNLKLHFNPRVILWNPESTDLSGCFQFIFRQLLWTRLYHPAWTAIFSHAIFTYLLLTCSFLGGLGSLLKSGNSTSNLLLWASLGIYFAAVLFALGYIHRVIRLHILPLQGNAAMPAISPVKWWQIALAALLTLTLYTWAILRARLATRVFWRGIEYQIKLPGDVQIVDYRPFLAQPELAVPITHQKLEVR